RSFDHGHFAELEGHVPAGADPAGVPRPPAPNMPWADPLNSNRIHPDAWNSQDLTQDEGPEWSNFGEDSDSMTVERVGEAAEEEGLPGAIDVPLGASAMRDCGIRAQVQGEDVDLVSYSEDQPVVIVGTLKEYELNSEISIEIRSDNLKRELGFDLSGVVSSIEKVADGQALFTVRLNMDSYQRISLIRDAITKRQEEIFKFFKQAKGS
ncbi:MAG: hypothetical protein EBX52_04015, partial [Proteobacteria bacterium]|nr:hypothetical protein [Pseudomonadota bacterium]